MKIAIPLGLEVFFGIRRSAPVLSKLHKDLKPYADRISNLTREHTYQFKIMSKKYDVKLLDRQVVQARVANVAILAHAYLCTLAKLDLDLRKHGNNGVDLEFARDRAAAIHFLDLAEVEIRENIRSMYENADDTMLDAADAALKHCQSLPNSSFIIPERTPLPGARGTGRTPGQDGIKQFPGEKWEGKPHQPVRPAEATTH
jgi:hypothetical protein